MAVVLPFQGIFYDTGKIENLSEVTTPPYDIISGKEQEAFYTRHPHNIIRLDKNMPTAADTDADNPYTRAAGCFRDWLDQKILIRDPIPAYYLTRIDFELEGKTVSRFGLIARVRLEPFDKGVVLPHEETFSKVKSERLELMKACQANFSHIFSIFSDKDRVMAALTDFAAGKGADQDFFDDAGHRHRLWRITDPDLVKSVADGFADRRLYIADGHHRYETALNYRNWLAQQTPELPADHPANYIMMYLCPVQDQGLIILPTHRLLSDIDAQQSEAFRIAAQDYFDITEMPVDPAQTKTALNCLQSAMAAENGVHRIGLLMKHQPKCAMMTLKPGIMEKIFAGQIPSPLLQLDVTVLTRLVLMKIMNMAPEDLDDPEKMAFTSNVRHAAAAIASGTHDVAFILNPPTNDQVRKIAEAGLTMPRKTTFYYPKVITGQVMNALFE